MILRSVSTWLKLAVITLFVSSFATSSFAAVDMFLVIKDGKGKVVSRCEVSNDGSFDCPSPLTKGTYTVSFEWSLGSSNPTTTTTTTSSGRSSSSSSSSSPSSIMCTYSVKSPRDAASGLATGKRQHKPFTITKQLDKSSPMLAKKSASVVIDEITVDEDCDGISGKISSKSSDNKPIELESWSWGVSNSR